MKANTSPSPRGRLATRLLLCACALFALFAAPARADEAAEQYVMDLVARAVAILDDQEEDEETRREAFRTLLLANVDGRRLPAFLLGQYARQLKPDDEQKHAYLHLLQEFMTRIYFVRLQEYADDSIKVTGSRARNEREVVVFGTILPDGRKRPLSLNWWLLRQEGGEGGGDGAESESFRIFDVQVAGIWLAQEVRAGFVSVIRNNQGSFDALLAHLRSRIDAQLETRPSGTEAQ